MGVVMVSDFYFFVGAGAIYLLLGGLFPQLKKTPIWPIFGAVLVISFVGVLVLVVLMSGLPDPAKRWE